MSKHESPEGATKSKYLYHINASRHRFVAWHSTKRSGNLFSWSTVHSIDWRSLSYRLTQATGLGLNNLPMNNG